MLNKPPFEVVQVPLTDAIFSSSSEYDTSDIAARIGLPFFTRRCPPDPKWAKAKDNEALNGESPFNNQDATFLHLCRDPNPSAEASSSHGPTTTTTTVGKKRKELGLGS